MNRAIEGFFYRRGFRVAGARRLVVIQAALAAGSCVAGLALGWAWPPALHFAVGALLATFNFYFLAKFTQRLLGGGDTFGAVPRQLLRFYGRIGLSAVALYVLIVHAGFALAALLAGLSTVVVTMLVWGVAQMAGKNVKEA
ncbi:MAG: ATP synthase subunit I [Thermodesulfobacteriota bacterium]